MRSKRSRHEGIEVRHSRSCGSRGDGECDCKPSYQASAWSRRDRKRIRKTFSTLAAAKAWRQDAQVALRRGTMRPPSKRTLAEAAEAWLAGIDRGQIRNRSGDHYKPSVRRGYESALRLHILPELGFVRLSELARNDVQDLADRLLADGLDPSTVRNALMPLRSLYRRAIARGEVAINPTTGIELPAVRGKRERIASPEEARQLLTALPPEDRALWATALYAGLRLGELQALRLEDIDLSGGIIRVERSWDPREGAIEPKSSAGRRTVPIAAVLRDELLEHWVRSGRESGLLFGRTESRPFHSATVTDRARRAWKSAGLEPIGLHECRHTFASMMIAAGVNAKALSSYLGHSSIQITLDRYGHLMPGNESEAACLLDRYLERATKTGSAPAG
jgi:integrase